MKRIFFVVFVLFFAQVKAIDEMVRNGYIYSPKYDAYYKCITEPASFHDSIEICSANGSRLFFPESEEEGKFAYELIPKHIPQIWIGAGLIPNDGIVKDVEGTGAIYLNTFTNLQVTYAGNGIAMRTIPENEYTFEGLNQNLPFICRKRNKTLYPSDERLTQLKKNGYTYDKRFNSLYKCNTREYDYKKALLLCSYDGGSTFYPESKEESLITRNVISSAAIILGAPKYLTSKNISESYMNWAWNKPRPEHDYIVMDYTGRFYGIEKRYLGSFNYICKIKLPVLEFSLATARKDVLQSPKFFIPHETIFPQDPPTNFVDEFNAKNYRYLEGYNSFYKFYDDRAYSLWTAALICRSDGSNLFFPESEEEVKAVFELIPQEVNKLLIGIMKTSSGKYYSLTGKVITYLKTELQNSSKSSGIILHRDLKYEDVNITEEYKFICKKSLYNPIHAIGIQGLNWMTYGYSYRSEFHTWYKYYDIVETFEYAFIQCLLDGATLFVPNIKMELKEIMSDMEISTPIWLGLTKFQRNYFVTVDGRLAYTIYHSWARNQPNLNYDYVALNKNGKYFTASKFHKNSFICKK